MYQRDTAMSDLDGKTRYDHPSKLYRSAPLTKPMKLRAGSIKRRNALAERIASRLSSDAIAEAVRTLDADDTEGSARRQILYQLTSQVPDFHRLTDEQRAILVAVKRETDLGRLGAVEWLLLMARFGQLKPQPT
jgi:hypothetical protein